MNDNDFSKKIGIVFLAGAGPGNEGLLTVHAQEILKKCDVLVYDALSNPAFLSETKESCEKIFVGKRLSHHSVSQEKINSILVEKALEGKTVLRLKGGDPFVFGRGGEEALFLEAHGISYKIIPGVTSAVAALESAGIPVTHREIARSFAVITGHSNAEDDEREMERFSRYANFDGTLVFLMGVSSLPKIVSALLLGGKNAKTPVSIVEWGTTVRERRIDATLETAVSVATRFCVKNPAVICVGEVAQFHLKNTSVPIFEKKIAITGTHEFVEKIACALKDCGALVHPSPFMKAEFNKNAFSLLPPFSKIAWLVFTSANGVRFFFFLLRERGIDVRSISHIKLCVVGQGTAAELKKFGFTADFVPHRFTVFDMAEEFLSHIQNNAGGIVCAVRALNGSLDLNRAFSAKQIDFVDVPLYSLSPNSLILENLLEQLDVLDYITFGSSSGASAFFDALDFETCRKIKESCAFICIGSKTSETVKNAVLNLNIKNRVITAHTFTAEGIIEAIKGDNNGNGT